MHYCVAYDIGSTRTRRRVVKWCKEAGLLRLQRSVFTGRSTPDRMRELETSVQAELAPKDRFFVIKMDADAWRTLRQFGDVVSTKVLGRARRRVYH